MTTTYRNAEDLPAWYRSGCLWGAEGSDPRRQPSLRLRAQGSLRALRELPPLDDILAIGCRVDVRRSRDHVTLGSWAANLLATLVTTAFDVLVGPPIVVGGGRQFPTLANSGTLGFRASAGSSKRSGQASHERPFRSSRSEGTWAALWGYSRAIRRGSLVEVSGTTAVGRDGTVIARGDVYAQTKHALDTIAGALAELGASLSDVIRTRVFLRDIDQWEEAGRAHREAFADVQPASTCLGGVDFLEARSWSRWR